MISKEKLIREVILIFLKKKWLQVLKLPHYRINHLSIKKECPIDYIGSEIPPTFVLGYGLDYDGLGRNLNAIYQLNKN